MQEDQAQPHYRLRILWVSLGVGFLFLACFGRLWYLQVTRTDYYARASERNYVRRIETSAPRGIIFDRKRRPLVDNIPSFSLFVKAECITDPERLARLMRDQFGLDPETVARKAQECRQAVGTTDVLLKSNLSFEECAWVEAHRNSYPELSIEWMPDRKYLYGDLFCHIVGYTGEITEAELNRSEDGRHRKGDLVGKTGMEKYYNVWLEGAKGYRKISINSLGQVKAVLEEVQPRIGKDLALTIDLDLQRTAFEAMADQKGALVAMDPWTGEVLAMVSNPGFDSNQFIGRLKPEVWRALLDNPDKPLQNKATQGVYAPGSVFKILVALAGLKEKTINPATMFSCNGAFELGGHVYHCWNKSGHGTVSLMPAIASSCNVYFYNAGLRLGIDKICKWSNALGMGRKTGLDLPDEKPGLVPSSDWKKRRYGKAWYQGETVAAAIGQGMVGVTPLQVAYFMSCVSTNRITPAPHLAFRERAGDAGPVEEIVPGPIHRLLIRSMLNVVEEGTGKLARVEGVNVAGKTGTAQVISTSTAERMADYKKRYRENSWFACFAPAEKPAIALAIIVEHGGHGGETAAPVAARVLGEFFRLNPEKVYRGDDD
ncbi:MAG: penicillin-binding protein 2 [Acidobacteria bacterium]|nr:penicillin-binding protein 2 [Acidobacteriota bacterium]